MERDQAILIAIIIVIIVAVVAIFAFSHPAAQTADGKLNTQINFLSKDSLKNGEPVQIELKDLQGNPIVGQTVVISFEENGQHQEYTVVTDNLGQAFLVLSGEPTGQHNIKVNYNGSDKYNGCTAEKTITIEEGQTTTPTTTANQSTASTVKYKNQTNNGQAKQTYYDKELNVYYDSNGRVIGGQSDGANIYELRNNYATMDTSSGNSE